MKVYFVTQKDMGKNVILKPRVPESAPDYEGQIPRICVSSSILGCLSSIGGNLGLECNTYIYSCDLDESEIIQVNTINDIDMTGELWILIEKEFILHKIIKIKNIDSFIPDPDNNEYVVVYNCKFDIIEDFSINNKEVIIVPTVETSWEMADRYNIINMENIILYENLPSQILKSIIEDNNYKVIYGEKYL